MLEYLIFCAPVFLGYTFIACLLALSRPMRPASVVAILAGGASVTFVAWQVKNETGEWVALAAFAVTIASFVIGLPIVLTAVVICWLRERNSRQ